MKKIFETIKNWLFGFNQKEVRSECQHVFEPLEKKNIELKTVDNSCVWVDNPVASLWNDYTVEPDVDPEFEIKPLTDEEKQELDRLFADRPGIKCEPIPIIIKDNFITKETLVNEEKAEKIKKKRKPRNRKKNNERQNP